MFQQVFLLFHLFSLTLLEHSSFSGRVMKNLTFGQTETLKSIEPECDLKRKKKNAPISAFFFSFFSPTRWLTVIVGEEFPIDLRMLKSFRCLRPLKMVSKVPSKLPLSLSHRDCAHHHSHSCRINSRFLTPEKTGI